jgi:tRNA wybutosine-synthesizing protein 1
VDNTCSGLNVKNLRGYTNLIIKAQPTYIEAEACMHAGFSRKRLGYQNMPSYDEVREFSKQLVGLTGHSVIDESEESLVALLSKLESSRRFGNG